MDIRQATKSYEAWMRACTKVVEAELTWKHAQMRTDLFMFFRGTYYRWAQLWPEVCNDLRDAPRGQLTRGGGKIGPATFKKRGDNLSVAAGSRQLAGDRAHGFIGRFHARSMGENDVTGAGHAITVAST